MVGNALHHRVPLTLFGGLATTRHGDHRDTLDLKHTGSVPIIDLARIYALAGGSAAVNTDERLAEAPASAEVTEAGSRDLRDALAFITSLRLRHQAQQVRAGEPPDNHIRLSEIGNLERRQLKDAFVVVQAMQSVLANRYR
jgi:CBS domain-containing protein